jgi:hypothetical protein
MLRSLAALNTDSEPRTYIADEALSQGVSGNVSLKVLRSRISLQTVGTLIQAGVGGVTPWCGG